MNFSHLKASGFVSAINDDWDWGNPKPDVLPGDNFNAASSPRYYLNSNLEILPCPQWGSRKSSEGLIPIFTDVAPQKECPIVGE